MGENTNNEVNELRERGEEYGNLKANRVNERLLTMYVKSYRDKEI